MMRSSNSKIQGKVEAVNSETPLENGLPPKERLPTIQIDTVPSPPPSPDEWTPPDESNEFEQPLDESDIQLDLETTEQELGNSPEDLKEVLKSYVEELLQEAMVLAEKKLQFAGLPEEDEEEEDEEPPEEPVQLSPEEPVQEPEKEIDDTEIRATAEKVVQEVISEASEKAAEKLENAVADLSFPGLPSIQIDTVDTLAQSPPPSPKIKEEVKPSRKKKKYTFKVEDDTASEKNLPPEKECEKTVLIKFDEAPEEVKEMATSFVKDIVGKAVAMAEEKSAPTVPFNFEDIDLMKTSGPWYIRAREALIRLLRTACFCTPRRTDS